MTGNTRLAVSRQKMTDVFGGKNEIQDQTIAFWCKTDWVDLLTPAPTTVLILGRLLQLSIPVDFKLVKPDKGFKHLRYDYFGASIQQIANQGVLALKDSRTGMDSIRSESEQIVVETARAIQLLVEGEGDDIPRYLPNTLKAVEKASQACLVKAQAMQMKWQALLELTQELQEVSKSTKTETDEEKQRAADQKRLLDALKAQEDKNAELAKTMMEDMKGKFDKSEEVMRESIKSMPNGWELGAMNVAQGLSKSLQSGVDAYMSQRLFKGNMIGLGQNLLSEKISGDQGQKANNSTSGAPSTAPNSQPPSQPGRSFSSPAYSNAAAISAQFDLLKHILTSGKDGDVDWPSVDGTEGHGKSSVRAIRPFFDIYATASLGEGKPSITAKDLIQKGIKYCDHLDELKVTKPQDKVKELVENVKEAAIQAKEFELEANLSTGSPPASGDALMNSGPVNVSDESSWSKTAVEMAQFKIKSAQALFSSNKEMYKHATDSYVDTTRRLAQFQGQLDQISQKDIKWDLVLDVLSRAINFLAQLNQCLIKLVTYFDAVRVIVEQAAGSKVPRLIELIEDATQDIEYGSFKASKLAKQAIYDQTRAGVKVTRVVQKIAQLYIEMYDAHIQKGVSLLYDMSKVAPSKDNKALLDSTGAELQAWSDDSTLGLQAMLEREAKDFESYINKRMKEVEGTFAQLMSIPNQELDRVPIDQVKKQFMSNEKKEIEANAENKPDYVASRLWDM